jgi:hypothetical protein
VTIVNLAGNLGARQSWQEVPSHGYWELDPRRLGHHLALLLLLAAIANTFFWNYWTLAYLRLSGHDHRVAV